MKTLEVKKGDVITGFYKSQYAPLAKEIEFQCEACVSITRTTGSDGTVQFRATQDTDNERDVRRYVVGTHVGGDMRAYDANPWAVILPERVMPLRLSVKAGEAGSDADGLVLMPVPNKAFPMISRPGEFETECALALGGLMVKDVEVESLHLNVVE